MIMLDIKNKEILTIVTLILIAITSSPVYAQALLRANYYPDDADEDGNVVLRNNDGYYANSDVTFHGVGLKIDPRDNEDFTIDMDGGVGNSDLSITMEEWYHPVEEETYLGELTILGTSNYPVKFINITEFNVEVATASIEYTNFTGTNINEGGDLLTLRDVGLVSITDCEFNTPNGGIYAYNIGEGSEISNCKFTGANEGSYGISVTYPDDNLGYTDFVIHENEFDQFGTAIALWDFLNGQNNGYAVDVSKNILQNCGDGIWIGRYITENSVLIRNNVIHSSDTALGNGVGIYLRSGPGYLESRPHIVNNAIFDNEGDGINLQVSDDGDSEDRWLRPLVVNNTIWENQGDGISIDFEGGADWDDATIVNNIMGENDNGLSMNIAPADDEVEFNAFKGNNDNISHTGGDNDDPLNDNCVIHDGGGGEWVRLVNENPSSVSWDFHILMDNIVITPSVDLNMDLANSDGVHGGDDIDDSWFDPRFVDRRGREFARSQPDFGIYGGNYSRNNIDKDKVRQNDYIFVEDPDIRRAYHLPAEYYRIEPFVQQLEIGIGESLDLAAGTVIEFQDNILDVDGDFRVVGGSADTMGILLLFDDGGYVNYSSSIDVDSCYIKYASIDNADYGAYLSGVDDTAGNRMLIDNVIFDGCGVGVYANNSRVEISNSTITNSDMATLYGAGVYLLNCDAGEVILDNNTITDNGTDATYASAGVYLNSSDPEMIWNTIENNSGAGVSCYGSNPDLDTWDAVAIDDRPNTIQTNGGVHSGSDGSEIYLANASYPTVKYNQHYRLQPRSGRLHDL